MRPSVRCLEVGGGGAAGILDPALAAAWEELEGRALEPNVFLSPHVAWPLVEAARAGGRGRGLRLYLVEEGRALLAVALLEVRRPSARLPLRHARGLASDFVYRGGLLLDGARARLALDALLRRVFADLGVAGALELSRTLAEGEQCALVAAVMAARGARWVPYARWERAALRLALPQGGGGTRGEPASAWSANRRKQHRRRLRSLEALGQVELVAERPGSSAHPAVETFLALEHAGWKGEGGTSLRADAAREALFCAMIDGLGGAGRAVFTTLRAGTRAVAASCNLVAGDVAFGFKMGWDPALAELAPGILHEELFVGQAAEIFPECRLVDSTSEPDSFVERIWPERIACASGAWVRPGAAAALLSGLRGLRKGRTR